MVLNYRQQALTHTPLSIFHSLSLSLAPPLAKIFFHKAQEQGNSAEISQAHHLEAKLMGCLICFH